MYSIGESCLKAIQRSKVCSEKLQGKVLAHLAASKRSVNVRCVKHLGRRSDFTLGTVGAPEWRPIDGSTHCTTTHARPWAARQTNKLAVPQNQVLITSRKEYCLLFQLGQIRCMHIAKQQQQPSCYQAQTRSSLDYTRIYLWPLIVIHWTIHNITLEALFIEIKRDHEFWLSTIRLIISQIERIPPEFTFKWPHLHASINTQCRVVEWPKRMLQRAQGWAATSRMILAGTAISVQWWWDYPKIGQAIEKIF